MRCDPLHEQMLSRWCEILSPSGFSCGPNTHNILVRKQLDYAIELCNQYADLIPTSIRRANLERRYEHLLGRLISIVLLSKITTSSPAPWIKSTNYGAPAWPTGIVGSISHTKELVFVSLAEQQKAGIGGLGVDLECLDMNTAITESKNICFSQDEIDLLSTHDYGLLIGFSVKEALYKTLHPICLKFIDFHDVQLIDFQPSEQTIQIKLLKSLSTAFSCGDQFTGKYQFAHNHVGTHVWIA